MERGAMNTGFVKYIPFSIIFAIYLPMAGYVYQGGRSSRSAYLTTPKSLIASPRGGSR